MASFTRKVIDVQLDFVRASKTIRGLAVDATILKPGPPQLPTASIKIYGMSLSDMEAFTTLAFEPLEYDRNIVTVLAGDEGGQMSVVFKGEVKASFANLNLSPNQALDIQAISGFYPSRIVGEPESVQGEAQVQDLCAKWAEEAEYNFVNFGVSASVRDCVFSGSCIDKIRTACQMVDCFALIDDDNIILLARDEIRQGSTPVISDSNGKDSYPVFTNDGIRIKTLYRPDIIIGGQMQVESVVPKATGEWQVIRINHTLSSFKPGGPGPWLTEVEGFKLWQ